MQHEAVDRVPLAPGREAVVARPVRDPAQPDDQVVELGVVQRALDVVAEQGPERLALPHAVEEPPRGTHLAGGQLHRERPVRGRAVGEVRVAQQRGGAAPGSATARG